MALMHPPIIKMIYKGLENIVRYQFFLPVDPVHPDKIIYDADPS
jgi:hypothetical protein